MPISRKRWGCDGGKYAAVEMEGGGMRAASPGEQHL